MRRVLAARRGGVVRGRGELAVCVRDRRRLEAATPGVTKASIVIGGSFPLSGPVSGMPPSHEAWRRTSSTSTRGRARTESAASAAARSSGSTTTTPTTPRHAVQLANKLVLEDKIFAIVGTLGTENNQAIRPFLNQRKIPQILVSTGASYWGLQYKQFPWTIGWQPDYISEGRAYGEWITKNAPNAKIAVFYQNDDYGKDYLRGLKIGLGCEDEPDRLRAVVRGHGHELRLADGPAEGERRGHVGPADDAGRRRCARSRRRRR